MEENATKKIKRQKNSVLKESILVDYGLKFILGISVVLIFLTAVQCSIKKPESPTWTTDLTVPMVNRTYTMPEIIEKIDQPNLYLDSTLDSIGAGGIQYYSYEPVFSYTDTLDTIYVSDNLTTENVSHYAAEELGLVTINPDNPSPVTVNLGDYVSLVLGDSVPPASFDIVEDIAALDKFSEAAIETGEFDVVFTNDFGLDLDTVIVRIYDVGFSAYISDDTIPDPGLLEGEVDTITVNLGGKTISNTLQLRAHCHTPGSAPSFTLSGKTMSSGMEMDEGLTVSSATAEVPQLSRNFEEIVDLVDSNTIQSATLASGNISVQIKNGTELETDFQITLADFNSGGSPLVINQTVAAGTIQPVNIDLAGYVFEPLDQTAPQSLTIDVSASIDSTAPDMVTIDQFDSLSVTADVTDLAFSSMTGIIQETDADFDNFELDIDLPKGFDEIQLSGAVLTLDVINGINFPGSLDITVTGDQGQNLNITGNIDAGSAGSPVISSIEHSDLTAFLNPIPTSVTVSGVATFGNGVAVGTVTEDDFVGSVIHINSPLEVIINETSFEGDITSETIEQDDIDVITDHVIEARFIANIINHLPVGVTAEIYLDGDSTHLNAAEAQLVVGPLTVNPGTVGIGGTVTEATLSVNEIILDSLEIKILENDTLYSGQLITLMDTDGQAVRITGDDYYTAQGVIQVEYRFDGEF